MQKVQITSPGIRKALRRYNSRQAISEYIWNGFDAEATKVAINYYANEIGSIKKLEIIDNGYGIPHRLLQPKFKPFFESEKELDPNVHRNTSAVHGKNGVGRLTFFHFATIATWETVYEEYGKKYTYTIEIDSLNLDSYSASEPIETKLPLGTKVTFHNLIDITSYHFDEEIRLHFYKEFGWFLELNLANNFALLINNELLNYAEIIGEKDRFNFQSNGTNFDIRYVRWTEFLDEYSRYYYLNSKDDEIGKQPTTLNNKGDRFYHSVFIKSNYFDLFTSKGVINQPSMIGSASSDEKFKELMEAVDHYLRAKRKPFLRHFSEQIIVDFEESGAFPKFNDNDWDRLRENELKNLVRELAQVEPKIFSRLNTEQKKTFAYLLNLIIDSGEKDKLFDILDEIVNLEPTEREELASLLKTSRLSSIVKTIKLIEDRYKTISQLRDLVFKKELGANERDHLQKAIEKHYWIFGEQFHLVTAEEPKFEEALRRHTYILHGYDERKSINHPDKNKEMDIFMVRQNMKEDTIHHIVVELKHPNKRLGEDEISQVKKYFRVILSQDEFNGSNMFWEFYLVGNKYDTSGFIEMEFKNAQQHGEKSLIFKHDKYKIYVKTWAQLFAEFELKHRFLNDKLQLERENLISEKIQADEIVTSLASNSAIQPSQVIVPTT